MTEVSFKSAALATGTTTQVATVSGDIVVVGTVDQNASPQMPSQQTTVTYWNAANPAWTRAIRASNVTVAVVRSGSTPVAWTTDLLVQASLVLEQSLTWDTYFSGQPDDATTGYYSVLTATGNPTAGADSVTIGGVAYNFVASLASAGDVLVGATAADTLANLAACLSGGNGAGTVYQAATVSPDATVSVLSVTDVALTVRAKAGVTNAGTTVSATAVAWSSTTLLTPYSVSFVAKALSELTPLSFAWHESDDGTFSGGHDTVLSTTGIYTLSEDGGGTSSVLIIKPTSLAKTGYSYRCVVSDSATSVLLSTGTQPADGDTVVIGGVTYTFVDTIGTAGYVLIGASVAATMANLAACIGAEAGGGSTYTATTVSPNASVMVTSTTSTSVTVKAKSGVTGVALTTASAGTEQVSWSRALVPNTATSDTVVLTVL